VLLASRAAAQRLDLCPIARVVACASSGVEPARAPLAAIEAVRALLARAPAAGVAPVDRWELNEAFAVKAIAFADALEIAEERLNVNGGAIAYGHPFSASGAIVLVHLLAELAAGGGSRGIAAIAGASGTGEAMLVERC
jgi:acetyl-CoA C-acetyltransferase